MKTFAVVLCYFLWLLNIIDYFTTDILVNHGLQEANPFMNWILQTHGMGGILAFKLMVLLILTDLVIEYCQGHIYNERRAVRWLFTGMFCLNILYLFVVGNNLLLYYDVAKPYFT